MARTSPMFIVAHSRIIIRSLFWQHSERILAKERSRQKGPASRQGHRSSLCRPALAPRVVIPLHRAAFLPQLFENAFDPASGSVCR